ncbi:hypothetical protein CR513_44151, partial [Mucuna pruriens]
MPWSTRLQVATFLASWMHTWATIMQMHRYDESKTTLLTNEGATYQRLMDCIFKKHIDNQMEVYVDDMVVKSETEVGHTDNLSSIFGVSSITFFVSVSEEIHSYFLAHEKTYERRGHMKVQVLADFINELTPSSNDEKAFEENREWTLSVDGSSNKRDSRVGIIIEDKASFQVKNNQAEYEALLARIRLAKELGGGKVDGKVNDKYQARDLQLIQYLGAVKAQTRTLEKFTLLHVPREKNERANLLANLASKKKGELNRIVIQEALGRPTIEELAILCNEWQSSWSDPIISYLRKNSMPDDPKEARKIKRGAAKYVLIVGQLYK